MSDNMTNETTNKKMMYNLPTSPPENPKNRDRYIDPTTGDLYSYWSRRWANKGPAVKILKSELEEEKKANSKKGTNVKKNVIAKEKEVTSPVEDELQIPPPPVEESPIEEQIENKPSLEPGTTISEAVLTEEDKDIKNAIEAEERVDHIKKMQTTVAPDPTLVQGNQFYFVVDITPPPEGNKVSFNFVDYLSRYFEGSTIYLIGINKEYTLDHFKNRRANVMWLKPSNKKILNSYIAYARRFYTFSQAYAKWAVEQNINACTLFLPKGKTSTDHPKLDILEVTDDVELEVVAENEGNVLTYK